MPPEVDQAGGEDDRTAEVVHRLSQPLTSIVLTSDLVLAGVIDETTRSQIARIRAAAMRLAEILGELAVESVAPKAAGAFRPAGASRPAGADADDA